MIKAKREGDRLIRRRKHCATALPALAGALTQCCHPEQPQWTPGNVSPAESQPIGGTNFGVEFAGISHSDNE
jgi:hypothetical protein